MHPKSPRKIKVIGWLQMIATIRVYPKMRISNKSKYISLKLIIIQKKCINKIIKRN